MKHTHTHANAKLFGAVTTAGKVNNLATTRHRRRRIHATVTITQMTYPTLWSIPNSASLTNLRTKTLRGIWGDTSKLRAVEVVLAILNDPIQLEPTMAVVANALCTAQKEPEQNGQDDPGPTGNRPDLP